MKSSLTKTLEGMLVLGTDAGCGKTTVITGLAAALIESGFRIQTFKPLVFCQEASMSGNLDQMFMNKITQQYIQASAIQATSAWDLGMPLWNRMIEQCKTMQYPCILEGPGQVATPWQILNHKITDGIDIATQLGLPILLVAKTDPTFLEKTRTALSFLKQRSANIIGFIRVQTTPPSRESDLNPNEPFLLSNNYTTPFLGDLPYSPSISVTTLQQGNLIRLIEENIDLLPLQIGIGLKL